MAHLEDLDRGAGRTDFQAERVAVAELGARHFLLARAECFDRPDGVAQLRRLLEALPVGRLLHAIPERLDENIVSPLEKELRMLDGLAVLVRASRCRARTARCSA